MNEAQMIKNVKAPQVEYEWKAMTKEIEGVDELLNMLYGRLSPILSEGDPEVAGPGREEYCGAPLAREIQSARGTIYRWSREVTSLLQRIEI